jgi:hypothetical protein
MGVGKETEGRRGDDAYVAPSIEVLGDVTELTLGVKGAGFDSSNGIPELGGS